MDSPRFHEADAYKQLFEDETCIAVPRTAWYDHLILDGQLGRDAQHREAEPMPLLDKHQEQVIFLRFNYARFRAEQARASISLRKVGYAKAQDLLRWRRLGLNLRDQIASYNLALVLAML